MVRVHKGRDGSRGRKLANYILSLCRKQGVGDWEGERRREGGRKRETERDRERQKQRQGQGKREREEEVGQRL